MLGLYFVIPASLIIALFAMNLYLSLVKHVCDKNLIRKQLMVQIVLSILNYLILILSKLPTIIRMIPTPYKASDLKNIMNGVRKIKDGDLEHVIQTRSIGLYRRLANDIN